MVRPRSRAREGEGLQVKPFYPTAIESQRRCPRRRAGRYLFRVKPLRQRDWARSLGDEVHTLAERWSKLGDPPIPDRTVADNLLIAGLPYLPPTRQGQSESEAQITLNGITYAMRRDWKGMLSDLPGRSTQINLATYGDLPAQLDLKTSSQPLRYGLWTREQFLDDTQALLGALELAESSGSDVVASRWLYFQTPSKDKEGNYRLKGKVEAFPSDMILGRDALGRAHLKLIEPAARAMQEQDQAFAAGQLTDFRQLPFNPLACDDYKGRQEYGCDFVPFCTGHMPENLNLAAPSRLVQAGYQNPQPAPELHTQVGPIRLVVDPSLRLGEFRFLPGTSGLAVGDRTHMGLFDQIQNGGAPAPVLGNAPPAGPAFAPPPPPAQTGAAPGFVRNANGSYSPVVAPVSSDPAFPLTRAPAPVTSAPIVTTQPALTAQIVGVTLPPAMAPTQLPPAPAITRTYDPGNTLFSLAPSAAPVVGVTLPPAPQLPSAPAAPAPFAGFVGVNAPELRAPFPPAPDLPPAPAPPTEAEALAALRVLRAFLSPLF